MCRSVCEMHHLHKLPLGPTVENIYAITPWYGVFGSKHVCHTALCCAILVCSLTLNEVCHIFQTQMDNCCHLSCSFEPHLTGEEKKISFKDQRHQLKQQMSNHGFRVLIITFFKTLLSSLKFLYISHI